MKYILAKKLKMTQLFDEQGKAVPVTILQAGPCFVTQIKSADKDGYSAVQVGYGEAKKLNKPRMGHLNRIQNPELRIKNLRYLREYQGEAAELKEGDEIKADVFKEGDIVKAVGVAKGKGFQGVVKRHGFGGAPATHGTKHAHRQPGSIGMGFPERVIKGMRMAGRMGGKQKTVRGLTIARVDAENNVIALKGAVPGNRGTLLEIIGE